MTDNNNLTEDNKQRVENKKDEAQNTYNQAIGKQSSSGYAEMKKRMAEMRESANTPSPTTTTPTAPSAGYEEMRAKMAAMRNSSTERPDFRSANNPSRQAEQFKADTTAMNRGFAAENAMRSGEMASNNRAMGWQGVEQDSPQGVMPPMKNQPLMKQTAAPEPIPPTSQEGTGNAPQLTEEQIKKLDEQDFNSAEINPSASKVSGMAGADAVSEDGTVWRTEDGVQAAYTRDGRRYTYYNGVKTTYTDTNGNKYYYDENGNIERTELARDNRILGMSFNEYWGRNSLGTYAMSHLGVNLDPKMVELVDDVNVQGEVKNDYTMMTDAQLTQAIATGNAGALGDNPNNNIAELRAAIMEKERRALNFSSVQEMNSLRGVRDLRLNGTLDWWKNTYYASQIEAALRGELDFVPTDPLWLNAIDLEIKSMKNSDMAKGVEKTYERYFNALMEEHPELRDNYAAWCLLKAYDGGKGYKSYQQVMDEAANEYLGVVKEEHMAEREAILDEAGKELADNKMAYLFNAVMQNGVMMKGLSWMFLSPEDRRRNAEIFNRANKYVGTGWQLGGQGLGFISDWGTFKFVGSAANWATRALLGMDAMEYSVGRGLASALNLGGFNVAGLAAHDIDQKNWSGGMSYLTTWLSGVATGSLLRYTGEGTQNWLADRASNFLFDPAKKLGKTTNFLTKFLVEGFTFGSTTTIEQLAAGDKITLLENYGNAFGMLIPMKLSGAMEHGKRYEIRQDTIDEARRAGAGDLADALIENRDRMRRGLRPLKYTGEARRQYERMFDEMNTGGKVKWTTLAEIAMINEDPVQAPRPAKSKVVKRGKNFVVQVLDVNDAIIHEQEFKKGKADQAYDLRDKIAEGIGNMEEAYMVADYSYARQSAIFADIAKQLYSEGFFQGDEPQFLPDGTPNPKFMEVPPDEIVETYWKVRASQERAKKEGREDPSTQFEKDLVERVNALYEDYSKNYTSVDEIIKNFSDQYGVFTNDFLAEFMSSPSNRGKNKNAAKAVGAFNEFMARGFNDISGREVGRAKLTDGSEVRLTKEPRLDGYGKASNPHETIVVIEENGNRRQISPSEIESYEKNPPSELEKRHQQSAGNAARMLEADLTRLRAVWEGKTTDELIDDYYELINRSVSGDKEGYINRENYNSLVMELEAYLGDRGVKMTADHEIVEKPKEEKVEEVKEEPEEQEVVQETEKSEGGVEPPPIPEVKRTPAAVEEKKPEPPQPVNEMKPAEVPAEEKKPEPVAKKAVTEELPMPENTPENIDKLLDAMGVKGEDKRAFMKEGYQGEDNKAEFEKDWQKYMTPKEEKKPATPTPPKEEPKKETPKAEEEKKPSEPVKEETAEQEVDYDKAQPSQIHQHLYGEGSKRTKEEADSMVSNEIEDAQKDVEEKTEALQRAQENLEEKKKVTPKTRLTSKTQKEYDAEKEQIAKDIEDAEKAVEQAKAEQDAAQANLIKWEHVRDLANKPTEEKAPEVKQEPEPEPEPKKEPAKKPKAKKGKVDSEAVKKRVAHFQEDSQEEFDEFENTIGDMSDEELLAYMKEDGNGNAKEAYHPTLYDEYDYRHHKDYQKEYDKAMRNILDNYVSQDEAKQMLEKLNENNGKTATEERTSILAQREALENFIRNEGVEDWIKENNWKEPKGKRTGGKKKTKTQERKQEEVSSEKSFVNKMKAAKKELKKNPDSTDEDYIKMVSEASGREEDLKPGSKLYNDLMDIMEQYDDGDLTAKQAVKEIDKAFKNAERRLKEGRKTKAEEIATKYSIAPGEGAESERTPTQESDAPKGKGGFVDAQERRKWASRNEKMTEVMEEIAKRLGLGIRTFYGGWRERGHIIGDTIWVNANSRAPLGFIMGHEMYHDVDSVGGEFAKAFNEIAKDLAEKRFEPDEKNPTYDEYIENLRKIYYNHYYNEYKDKGYSGEEAHRIAEENSTREKMLDEQVADESGYILEDEKAAVELLKKLDMRNKRTFKDIVINLIDKVYSKLGKDSPEFVKLNKTRNALIEAYREAVEKNRGDRTKPQEERYSLDTTAMQYGLRFEKGEDGVTHFYKDYGRDENGNPIKGEEITKFTIKHIEDTPVGAVLKQALRDGTISPDQYKRTLENQRTIMQYMKDTPDLDLFFAVSGAIGFAQTPTRGNEKALRDYYRMDSKGMASFVPYKSNSETQYATTFDVTTICRKTQTIIDVMSKTMMEQGHGMTVDEVIKIVYDNVYKMGKGKNDGKDILVPCDVCYVFNRWVNLGNLFDSMKTLRDTYEDKTTEEIAKDRDKVYSDLCKHYEVTGKGKEYKSYKQYLDALEAYEVMPEGKAKRDAKKELDKFTADGSPFRKAMDARRALVTEEVDRLNFKIFNYERATNKSVTPRPTAKDKKRLAELQTELNFLDKATWFEYVRLQPDYEPIPDEVLFDINRSYDFKEKYPGAWKYRTTRGSGMGKAAAAYAPEYFGSGIVGAASGADAARDMSKNIFLERELGDDGKWHYKYIDENTWDLKPEAVALLRKAQDGAAAQNYLNGQRWQSTSDTRVEYLTDYNTFALEQMVIGSKGQGFTKVPECAKFFGDTGAMFNLSLIGSGSGWREITRAEYMALPAEEKRDCAEVNGRLYQATYSDVSGIKHEDAFRLSDTYGNIQPIMVCLNDTHLRLCMALAAQGRITFNIPYHSSGDSIENFLSKAATVGDNVDVDAWDDYTKFETDQVIPKTDEKNYNPNQATARDVFKKIKSGAVIGEEGMAYLRGLPQDNVLRQLYMRFRGEDVDGGQARILNKYLLKKDRGADGYGTLDSQCRIPEYDKKTGKYLKDADGNPVYKQVKLTSKQAELLMTNDYWDKTINLADADKNGQAFLDLCNQLGYYPRFGGWKNNQGKFEYIPEKDFTKDTGYWSTLIDISMYDLDGKPLEQQAIDASAVGVQHFDREAMTNLNGYRLTEMGANPGIDEPVMRDIRRQNRIDIATKREHDKVALAEAYEKWENKKRRSKNFWESAEVKGIDTRWMQDKWNNDPEFVKEIGKIVKMSPKRRQAYAEANIKSKLAEIDAEMTKTPTQEELNKMVQYSLIGPKGARGIDESYGFRPGEEESLIEWLKEAERLEKRGESYDAIRWLTSWERGADGKWRHEIPDVKIKDDKWYEKSYISLEDLVYAPTLFDAYPEMREILVLPTKNMDYMGAYNPYRDTIEISIEDHKDNINEFRSTLAHEIQHAIQHREGFAVGGSAEVNDVNSTSFKSASPELKAMMILGGDKPVEVMKIIGPDMLSRAVDGAIPAADKKLVGDLMALRDALKAMTDREYESFVDDAYKTLETARQEARDGYIASAGEVEARNVETRLNYDWDEREETPARDTESIPRDRQVVKFSLDTSIRPTFYSNAARAVENIKQNKATAEQWLAMIKKNGGLKAGEDKWMGLSQWLEDNKGKSLTKDEVLQFVRDNGIQMEEVKYSDKYSPNQQRELDRLNKEFAELLNQVDRYSAYNQMVERYGIDFSLAFGMDENSLVPMRDADGNYLNPYAEDFLGKSDYSQYFVNSTRLDYTTKGLENKREIAFKVPNIEPYQEYDEVHFGPENEGKAVMWVRFGETTGIGYNDGGKKRAEFEKIAAENEQWYKDHPQFAKYGVGDASLKQESEARKERQRKALEEAKATEVPARVLVIDEIQSNRHQDAREKGYRSTNVDEIRRAANEAKDKITDFSEQMKRKYGSEKWYLDPKSHEDFNLYTRLTDEWMSLADERDRLMRENRDTVPAAPFEKNWHEVAMKRMLRLAAEEGFDKVAWTTGEQQADRYSLGRMYDSIEREDNPSIDGKRFVLSGRNMDTFLVNKEGNIEDSSFSEFYGIPLSDVVGKDLAERMMNLEDGDMLEGEDLRIGGEGMKGFYDNMLPRFMDKYGKRWGVKTGEVELNTPGKEVMHSVDVTPEMKESVMQGQPLFSLETLEGADRLEYTKRLRDIYREGVDVDDRIRQLDEEFEQREVQAAIAKGEPLPYTGFDSNSPMQIALDAQMKAINNVNTSDTVRRDAIKSVTKNIRKICNALKNMTFDKLEEETWQKLSDLEEAYEAGAFTKEEYERQKKELEALSKGDTNTNVRMATTAQRDSDKATVAEIVGMARTLIESGLLDDLGRGEVKRIFGDIKRADGKTSVGVRKEVEKLFDLMLEHQAKRTEKSIQELLGTQAAKVDSNGVKVVGKVDAQTKRVLDNMAMYLGWSVNDMDDVLRRLSNVGTDNMNERQLKEHDDMTMGAEMAKRYAQSVVACKKNIAEAKAEMERLKERYKNGEINITEYRESKRALENTIRENQTDMVKGLWETEANLRELVAGGKKGAKSFFQKVVDRANQVRHWANSDLRGIDTATQMDTKGMSHFFANMGPTRFISMSQYTFNTMLRAFGRNAYNGEGYLFDNLGRTWMDNASSEWKDNKRDMDELNAKANELFGNLRVMGRGPQMPFKYKWHNLIDVLHRLPKITVEYRDGGKMRPHKLDQAQAAYIYAANKQTDGAVKLRYMGITEAEVERIKNELDPRVIKLVDWLQNEFLPSRYEGYSAVYEKMFGVPMTMNDNYFPLAIDKLSVEEKANDQVYNASTTTGSVKERTFNVNPLDIKGTNIISLISTHLDEMNHWKNFAEWNRDLNTLLNDKTFRAKVHNLSTFYGAGDKLWKRFKDVSLIASGDYIPVSGELDKFIVNVAKLVSAAKVNFRSATAAKQILSFLTPSVRSNPLYFIKNLANEWGTIKWCFENLPLFEKRWISRRAGDARLQDTDLDWKYTRNKFVRWAGKWGLTPNAAVDLWACAIGARSVYDTMYKSYTNKGYSAEEARRRAIQDAQMTFNESQQSSEAMFLSPMQVDRTLQSVAMSVFRTSPFGFTRLATQGMRNVKYFMSPWKWREHTVYMYKKMLRDGLTREQAKDTVKHIHARSLVNGLLNIFMYGFGAQWMWNNGSKAWYYMGSDNDERRKELLKEETLHAALAGYIEGVPGGSLSSDFLSSIINAYVESEDFEGAWKNFKKGEMFKDNELLPLFSDWNSIKTTFLGGEYLTGVTDLCNLALQSLTGANPQTFTDTVAALMDACNNDPKTAKDALLLWYRIAQVPQSQIDDIYIEEAYKATGSDEYLKETGMTKEQIENMTLEEFAKRYAGFRRLHRAPYLWELYNQEKKKELVEKYEERFYEKLKAGVDDPGAWRDLAKRGGPRQDKFLKKYVEDTKAAYGVDGLAAAADEESDPHIKALLVKAYSDAINEEELKRQKEQKDALKEASKAEEESKQLTAAAKYLPTKELISAKTLSVHAQGFHSDKDPLMHEAKELGVTLVYQDKDKNELGIEESYFKLPFKDKEKEAKADKLLKDNAEHFRRVKRAMWRAREIKRLIAEIEEDSSKKDENVKKIIQINKDETDDYKNYQEPKKKK